MNKNTSSIQVCEQVSNKAQVQKSPWFLYMVKTAQNTLYTGISIDIKRRFAEHQAQSAKTAKALKGKGPLELVFTVQLPDHGEALRAEMWVKKQRRAYKLALVAGTQNLPFAHTRLKPQQYC